MSRVLITGGAGCLGSNLIERWLPNGHDILVIDNFATGKRNIFSDLSGLKIIEGTIADASLVDRCFEEFTPEIVIHSAAAYKDPSDWEEDAATNVNGTINDAKAAERFKIRRFVNFRLIFVMIGLIVCNFRWITRIVLLQAMEFPRRLGAVPINV